MKLVASAISIIILLIIINGSAQQSENIDTKQVKEKIKVVASFYPFYEIAKEIGGNNTLVISVIPMAVEHY
jgi:ABC-type Zn uptake system ZnuABC Zn-binding protein ZnuA